MRWLQILLLAWAALVVSAMGASFVEDFSQAPTAWTARHGEAFRWDAEAKNLAVTWDSRETNAFFYFPLPFALTRADAFAVEFTLRLTDIQLGINPGKDDTFPLCLGFLNLEQALRTNYFRGAGVNAQTGPRSVAEFAYFPDSGFGATVGPVVASTNNQMAFSHTHPVELAPGDLYRVRMAFDPAAQQLITTLLHNGEPYGEGAENVIRPVNYTANFGDFRVDALSIHSYSDAGQSPPQFAGSLLAHGTIDDVVITWPDVLTRVAIVRREGEWLVAFDAVAGWNYTLERKTSIGSGSAWEDATLEPGVNGRLELKDADPSPGQAFYRVRGERE